MSVLLVRWAACQPHGRRHVGGILVASALAFVAWWLVLVGVGGLLVITVGKLLDGAFAGAAIGGDLVSFWATGMTIVFRRHRRRPTRPFEIVDVVALCAGSLAVPLVGAVLVTSVI